MSRFPTAKQVTPLLLCGVITLAGFTAIAHEKAATVAPKTAATNPTAEKVLAVIEQFKNAIKTGDVAQAERSMAENISIFEQGHAEQSRAEYLGDHFKQDVAFAKGAPSVVVSTQVKVDGNMALVTAFTTTDGIFKDKPIKDAGVSTYVLRLKVEGWQIEHIHWSSRMR